MPAVAPSLLVGQADRLGPRQPLGLPLLEAAGHRDDVPVAQHPKGLGGEDGADARRAIQDDGGRTIRDRRLDLLLDAALGHVMGAGDVALLPLPGLAHVDEGQPGRPPAARSPRAGSPRGPPREPRGSGRHTSSASALRMAPLAQAGRRRRDGRGSGVAPPTVSPGRGTIGEQPSVGIRRQERQPRPRDAGFVLPGGRERARTLASGLGRCRGRQGRSRAVGGRPAVRPGPDGPSQPSRDRRGRGSPCRATAGRT